MEVPRLVAQALAHAELPNEIPFPDEFYPMVEQYDRMVAGEEGTEEARERRRQRAFGVLADWMTRVERATGKSGSCFPQALW